jgi:hypothetical protein
MVAVHKSKVGAKREEDDAKTKDGQKEVNATSTK